MWNSIRFFVLLNLFIEKIESEHLARQCNPCTFVAAFQGSRQFNETLETFCCHFSFQSNWNVYTVLVV